MAILQDPDGIQRQIFSLRLKDYGNDNLAVDGSVTPISYKLQPESNQIMRVVSWSIYIQDEKGFTITEFASMDTVLANGLEIKANINNNYENILGFNLCSNSCIMSVTYDLKLEDFGGSGTDDVLMAKWNLADSCGQMLRLDGSQGEFLEIIVNDDLTSISNIYVTTQGYYE